MVVIEDVERVLVNIVPMQKTKIERQFLQLDDDMRIDLIEYVSTRVGQGSSIEEICDAYKFIVDVTNREQLMYIRNKASYEKTQSRVVEKVYEDQDYMQKYMTGLAISMFIWPQHLALYRFFKTHIKNSIESGQYMEIGPGHGIYGMYAVKTGAFDRCTFVDISEQGIDMAKGLIGVSAKERYYCCDIMEYHSEKKFNFICAGEVIEAVGNPLGFLGKIKGLLAEGGRIFISTPVNSAVPDSVNVFGSIDSIENLIHESGLKINDAVYVPYNQYSLEESIKRQLPVNVGYILSDEK